MSLRGRHLTLLPASPSGHRAMPLSSPLWRIRRDPQGAALLAGVRTTGQPLSAVSDLLMRPPPRPGQHGPLLAWPLHCPLLRKHLLAASLLCSELGRCGDCYVTSMSLCQAHTWPLIATGCRNIVQ